MADCSICGEKIPQGSRTCAVCGSSADDFFPSSTMLPAEKPAPILDDVPMAALVGDVPMAPILDDVPMAPILEDEPAGAEVKFRAVKPPSGTPCLVLYGADRQPLQYFALTKDAMLIGRLDAVAGNFPDIDLDAWFDRATIRKISRQHALILRTRASASFALRPLLGNTGTQLETQMVQPQQDYPLRPGHRIILGGVIRLKFEIA
jgi:hypothetical protein